jgi:porin
MVAASLAGALAASAGQGWAAPPPISVPASSSETSNESGPPSDFLENLNRSSFLLGDMFGLRTELSAIGMTLAIQETSEDLGNLTGGVHRGFDYDGLTQAILQLNTQRAFGWYGGTFNVSALQIHGRDLSTDNLATLQTASGIEGDRSTRLWELWYDQKFLAEDRADIKIGQQSVDQEFIVSQNASYFINTMFGWPATPSYDLPGGGPAYPLSALGVRLRWRPVNPINILLGVFSGGPAPSNSGDPQRQDPSGTSFPANNGALVMFEAQYSYPTLGGMVYPGQGAPLGGTYKIGAWYDSQSFADERFDSQGVPLAWPAGNDIPLQHRGDYSIYAVADQMVWRQADTPNRSISVFARVMATPEADRNLITFSMNAGLVYHDPIANRPDDTVGIGMGFARVSSQVAAAERDAATFAPPGSFNPVQGGETYVEVTYQYQFRPWLQLQPDIQYVFNPGAGVVDPLIPTQRVQNEVVIGGRTNILF